MLSQLAVQPQNDLEAIDEALESYLEYLEASDVNINLIDKNQTSLLMSLRSLLSYFEKTGDFSPKEAQAHKDNALKLATRELRYAEKAYQCNTISHGEVAVDCIADTLNKVSNLII